MKTVLITGANRGIGLELSHQYYQSGWHVIACIRHSNHSAALNKLLEQPSKGLLTIYNVDVTIPDHINRLSAQLENHSIDILINNAGVWGGDNQTLEAFEVANCLDVFKVNTIAPLLMTRAFLPYIENSQLKIIANVSSIMGSISLNTTGSDYIYRTSKAALNAITKNLSIELETKGITVIALHPGWVQTDMGGTQAAITPQESCQGILKLLNSLTLEDSGRFLDYQGKNITY
jgi:NAD(P)-dependent dehydrogenase (short-subunit alcohol dehydrogenase family)